MPKVSRRHAIARLGRAVSDQQPTGRLTLETATVTAVDVGAGTDGGDVVTVDLYGGTPAPHLASYSPNGPTQLGPSGLAQEINDDVQDLVSLVLCLRADTTVVNGVDLSPTHVVAYDVLSDVVGTGLSFASGVVTAVTAGYYEAVANVEWPVNSSPGIVASEFFLNGSGSFIGRDATNQSSAHRITTTSVGIFKLAINDTLQLGLSSLDGIVNNVFARMFSVKKLA